MPPLSVFIAWTILVTSIAALIGANAAFWYVTSRRKRGILIYNPSSNMSLTLPSPKDSKMFNIINMGPGALVINSPKIGERQVEIDGVSSLVMRDHESRFVLSDGENFFTTAAIAE